MEVTFINPGVDYMIQSIMHFQTEGEAEFWSEPLYHFYPQLDRTFAASLPVAERRDYIERTMRAAYAELEDTINEKVTLYSHYWNACKAHRLLDRCEPIVRSFDDVFYAPHSRYFGVKRDDVLANEHLMLLAESDEAGCYLIKDDQGNIYLLGHPEYDRMSLDAEYKRDLAKGMDAEVPVHYYENDDPSTTPLLTWRGHANTLYTNWLNFYVYQATPYKW